VFYELDDILGLTGMGWDADAKGYTWNDHLILPTQGHIAGGWGGGLRTEEIGHWGYYWTSDYGRNDALCQTRRGGRSLLPLQKDRPPIWYASQSAGLFVARRL